MGATHFLMKTLPRVASEMALHLLACNLTRVMSIMGIRPPMAGIRAQPNPKKASTPPDQNCYASTLPAKRFYTTKTHSGDRAVIDTPTSGHKMMSGRGYSEEYWMAEAPSKGGSQQSWQPMLSATRASWGSTKWGRWRA